jgi:hypothetical protein
MMPFMLKSNDGELGILMIKKINPFSPLSLKTSASPQQGFILKDGRKVSLNPKLMRGR